MNRQARRHPLIRRIEGDGGAGGTGGAPPAPPTPPAPVQFTPEQQAAIDQIVQGRVAQASRTAAATKEQELKDYLAEQKRIADLADADEITQAKAAQAAAEATAAKATAEAAATLAKANATTALVTAGVQPAVIDDALRLIDPAADDLPNEIEALKGRLPALFTPAGEGTPPPPAPNIQPPPRPAGTGGTAKSMAELGQEEARRLGWLPNNAA